MVWEGSAIEHWYQVIALAATAVRAGFLWPDARTRTADPWSCGARCPVCQLGASRAA